MLGLLDKMAIFGKSDLTDLVPALILAEIMGLRKFDSGAASGSLQYIYLYCDDQNSLGPMPVYAGIYSHNAGSNKPLDLLDSGSATLALGAPLSWLKISMNAHYVIEEDTTYWLTFQFDGDRDASDQFGYYRKTLDGSPTNNYVGLINEPAGYDNWPDPWTAASSQKTTVAIYAETGLPTFEDQVDINSDASIQKTDQIDINSDAHIWATEQTSVNSDANINIVDTVTINSDANIWILDQIDINSNASIQKTDQYTITADAEIFALEQININSDAHIWATEQVDVNSNASIQKVDTITIKSNALIIPVWPPTDYAQRLSDAHIQHADEVTITSNAVISAFDDIYATPAKIQPYVRPSQTPNSTTDDGGFEIF